MISPRDKQKQGFTLIELLVSVALLAILISLLMPAIKIAIDQSKTTKCASNIRKTYSALIAFIVDHDGSMPPYREFDKDENGKDTRHETWGGWIKPYFQGANERCPSAEKTATVWYAIPSNISKGGRIEAIYGKPTEKFNQTQIPSKRLLIGDSVKDTRLTATAFDVECAFRHHGERANLIFFDGHVEARTLAEIPLERNGFKTTSPEYKAFWTKGE